MSIPSGKKINDLNHIFEALGLTKDDLKISYITGNSNGGQKQNSSKNCVSIKHIPSELTVKCHKSRSREENLFFAKRQLLEKLCLYFGIELNQDNYDRIRKQKQKSKKRQKIKQDQNNT
jgi:protein subunit release factor A